MTVEREPKIVIDSGCSIRPEHKEAQELGVTIVPLDIKFYENGEYVPYEDLDISPAEFYRRMKEGKKLPQTSGAITGRVKDTYVELSHHTDSILSIHITSKHSASYSSSILGKEYAKKEKPELLIEVVDSKQISVGMWFLAEHAAEIIKQGANLEQTTSEVLELVPNIELYAVLESFENLKHGGRAQEAVKAHVASFISLYPVLGLDDGKLVNKDRGRTPKKARKRMVEKVADSGELVKVAVLHTNAPLHAQDIKESLESKFSGEIPIYEAGPVLGVHAGEGTVGVVFQKK